MRTGDKFAVIQQRPVNLDLTKFHFPVPAIVSILHRMSGVILFLAIPLMLWWLQQSLASKHAYQVLQQSLTTPIMKLTLWAILVSLSYHIIAGTRHLLMDMGIGESLEGGRWGALSVLSLSIVAILWLGYVLW